MCEPIVRESCTKVHPPDQISETKSIAQYQNSYDSQYLTPSTQVTTRPEWFSSLQTVKACSTASTHVPSTDGCSGGFDRVAGDQSYGVFGKRLNRIDTHQNKTNALRSGSAHSSLIQLFDCLSPHPLHYLGGLKHHHSMNCCVIKIGR